LQRIGRTAKDPVKLRRAIVLLMSAQGQSAPDIAHLLAVARAVSTLLTESARAA
jgi:transposase